MFPLQQIDRISPGTRLPAEASVYSAVHKHVGCLKGLEDAQRPFVFGRSSRQQSVLLTVEDYIAGYGSPQTPIFPTEWFRARQRSADLEYVADCVYSAIRGYHFNVAVNIWKSLPAAPEGNALRTKIEASIRDAAVEFFYFRTPRHSTDSSFTIDQLEVNAFVARTGRNHRDPVSACRFDSVQRVFLDLSQEPSLIPVLHNVVRCFVDRSMLNPRVVPRDIEFEYVQLALQKLAREKTGQVLGRSLLDTMERIFRDGMTRMLLKGNNTGGRLASVDEDLMARAVQLVYTERRKVEGASPGFLEQNIQTALRAAHPQVRVILTPNKIAGESWWGLSKSFVVVERNGAVLNWGGDNPSISLQRFLDSRQRTNPEEAAAIAAAFSTALETVIREHDPAISPLQRSLIPMQRRLQVSSEQPVSPTASKEGSAGWWQLRRVVRHNKMA